ncbi:helix-turn-helix transcriptional regulator [Bradyrhizobium sp.]|uniref:helix-turn-helix transcriptional regulator n=1 Tax=Bradyrhizobium sp. TaxID=376 RepID=UPI0027180D68|nr:helix-turn-helix transcriptional regulator [Bradyrhizobium sp.]MDO9294775.1 helix-turn-helix transcriptional regulator [Bradyrhizobium sp.]
MDDREQLSALIGDIYDAVFDPDHRTDVLDRIADFAGGDSGGLLSKHALGSSLGSSLETAEHLYCYIGNDSEGLRAYSESYPKLDSTADPLSVGVEQIVSTTDLVPYEEFRRGRFYREWARPHGWIDIASAVVEKSATSCTFISVARREASGLVDADMRRRMALIIPHVRRAILIGRTIHHKEAEATCLTDILDGLSAGMILVDAGGRIVHANAAGSTILAAADFLRRTPCGRLVAGEAPVNAALREILLGAGGGDAALGVKGIALPLTARSGERYVAHVLPLTSGARRKTGLAYDAVAALFVRKAALEAFSPSGVIGQMYNLTPTELRVLLAIVDVGGVPEVAASLGVAATTIKTHLSRLFEKTGVGRQADLVKLVAGFATPLAS